MRDVRDHLKDGHGRQKDGHDHLKDARRGSHGNGWRCCRTDVRGRRKGVHGRRRDADALSWRNCRCRKDAGALLSRSCRCRWDAGAPSSHCLLQKNGQHRRCCCCRNGGNCRSRANGWCCYGSCLSRRKDCCGNCRNHARGCRGNCRSYKCCRIRLGCDVKSWNHGRFRNYGMTRKNGMSDHVTGHQEGERRWRLPSSKLQF